MTDFGVRRRTLPKTGQATSYRDGDDGFFLKGWAEGERFKDVGDGTVVDNATGLMWPKDFCGDGGNGGNALAWSAAIDWAEALDFAGHSDWRLPNWLELISIYNAKLGNPPTYDVFDNVVNGIHWSSTTDPASAVEKITIAMQQIYVKKDFQFMSHYSIAVRDA